MVKIKNAKPAAQVKPLLQKANELINGDRQGDYGDKLSNFTQIAKGFDTVLSRKLAPNQSISALDVALLMMQVKIVRLAHKPDHYDSLLDIAGYAGCAEALQLDEASVAAGTLVLPGNLGDWS